MDNEAADRSQGLSFDQAAAAIENLDGFEHWAQETDEPPKSDKKSDKKPVKKPPTKAKDEPDEDEDEPDEDEPDEDEPDEDEPDEDEPDEDEPDEDEPDEDEPDEDEPKPQKKSKKESAAVLTFTVDGKEKQYTKEQLQQIVQAEPELVKRRNAYDLYEQESRQTQDQFRNNFEVSFQTASTFLAQYKQRLQQEYEAVEQYRFSAPQQYQQTIETLQQQYNEARAAEQNIAQQYHKGRAEYMRTLQNQAKHHILRHIPDFGPEHSNLMGDTLHEFGYSPEELKHEFNGRLLMLAYEHGKLKKEKAELEKKISQKEKGEKLTKKRLEKAQKKEVKPGQSKRVPAGKKPDPTTKGRRRYQEGMQRLKQSGKVDDAAALIAQSNLFG
jgi:hypothetical protein